MYTCVIQIPELRDYKKAIYKFFIARENFFEKILS